MDLKYELFGHNYKPRFKTPGSACFDLMLPKDVVIHKGVFKVPLDIAFDIPPGWCVRLYPRSSALIKFKLLMPVSIVDSDYKDIVHCIGYCFQIEGFNAGESIVQGCLEPVDKTTFIEVIVDNDTGRGGFGSTGK